MLFRFPKTSEPRSSEITSRSVYQDRRRFMTAAAAGAVALGAPGLLASRPAAAKALEGVTSTAIGAGLKPNAKKDAITYNNFYELGTGKDDPSRYGHLIKPRPWTIEVTGEVEKPGTYDLDMLIPQTVLEERIYRLRCVEAWSMVIPWVGVPLASVIDRFAPTSKAKYVAFETLVDPKQMPGVNYPVLEWPYREGLRMDEAMNPLSFLAVGLYGETLPGQNGAPVRLVLPWKYGFKSIKSIVTLRFSETMPKTSWNMSQSREYGFYANVNPMVDHPRWSQAKERRIGEFFKQDTVIFNGYGDEVAGLYKGMDLAKNF